MDEFREERENLKNASFQKKWKYFWDYYKLHVVIGGFVAFFVISMAHSILTAKDNAFFGYFLNCYAEDEQNVAFVTDFAEAAEIDLKEYEARIDTTLQYTPGSLDENTYTSSQKVMVTMAASDVDFLAADSAAFTYYATSDSFYDLRELFSEEELEKLQDYIYYIDMDVVRERENIVEAGNFQDYTLPTYDNFAPEEMGDPVPIALNIKDCPKLKDTYYFQKGAVPMGIVINSQRLDNTMKFVRYLFEDVLK